MERITEDQIQDLEVFAANEGTEIGETVSLLLGLYSHQPYIGNDKLVEEIEEELLGWLAFYHTKVEWTTSTRTVEYKEMVIKE